MALRAGQLISCGPMQVVVRVSLGPDLETGIRSTTNKEPFAHFARANLSNRENCRNAKSASSRQLRISNSQRRPS